MNDTPTFTPKPLALAVALAVGGAGSAEPALANAGKVAFAWGDVSIEGADGSREKPKRGTTLESGDTVNTGRGRAQLRFKDGSFVSLQPESSFKIEDFNYEEAAQAEDRSVFRLFRGGLRTITGLIGKRSRDAYRVDTPVATIGIRGTAFKLNLLDDGSLALECADGAISAENDGGTQVFVGGEIGRVLNQFTKAEKVIGEQGEQLLVLSPPDREINEEDLEVIGDDGEPSEVILNVTDLSPDEIYSILVGALGEEQAGDLMEGVFPGYMPPVEVPPPGEPLPAEMIALIDDATDHAVAYACDGCEGFGGFPVADIDNPSSTVFIDVDGESTGQLDSWENDDGYGGLATTSRDGLSLKDDDADDIIAWGRWAGAGTYTGEGMTITNDDEEDSLHYVVGRPTDMSSIVAGTGYYAMLGNTTPTREQDGATGTYLGGAFMVNFTDNQVDGRAAFSFDAGTKTYELDFAGANAADGTFTTFPNIDGMGGGACDCGCSSKVAGLVAGDFGERAGFVYHVEDFGDSADMYGAATFKQVLSDDPTATDPSVPIAIGMPPL
ncbi:MAG: FecR family protein [Gammaproteobacteria bacterium]